MSEKVYVKQNVNGVSARQIRRIEWPTLGLFFLCYSAWFAITFFGGSFGFAGVLAAIPLLAVVIALHSSLQHEVIHGHPFPAQWMSNLLVSLPVGLFVPYLRFRETHLAHHQDPNLTDPYDDPESNFWCPESWEKLPSPLKAVFRWNNTLLGRMLIGPLTGTLVFVGTDVRKVRGGDWKVLLAWLHHALWLLPLLFWLAWFATIPFWAYMAAAFFGMSLLKIRTFLEHQAHERHSHRSVIIEDRGLLSLLFLNNNFHLVHHARPRVPWYDLPGLYHADRERFLTQNGSYRYSSYMEVFRRYLLRAKDPVPHPMMHRK